MLPLYKLKRNEALVQKILKKERGHVCLLHFLYSFSQIGANFLFMLFSLNR